MKNMELSDGRTVGGTVSLCCFDKDKKVKSAGCPLCGGFVSDDSVGLYKKLIDGSADRDYPCISCLAKRLGCSEALLQEKADRFRASGCLLFRKPEKR